MRPRIQATISQKAYDIVIDEMSQLGSSVYNRSFSRAIDTIILEWEDYQKQLKVYQEKAAQDFQQMKMLKEKVR